ncbi:MAG: hypothetical protein HYZ56_02690 [Nitrosopumilales archaeon]|nr:hypothetical protein [Nitrosopumilales archaeon]
MDVKGKYKILAIISAVLILMSFPYFFPHFVHGHGLHVGIHLASVILGLFLSIVGALAYLEYKTKRLFLMLCAFCAITLVEIVSAVNIVFLFWPSHADIDSLFTHGLILATLSFFVIGIFRTD